MLSSLVLAGTLVLASDPGPIPFVSLELPTQQASTDTLVRVTKDGLRLEFTREMTGEITKLKVRRVDGKRMTSCEPYMAIQEFEYRCSYWPSEPPYNCGQLAGVASGIGYGESDTEACQNASTAACDTHFCMGEVEYVQFCDIITDWLGVLTGESGGVCYYGFTGYCYGSSWYCD